MELCWVSLREDLVQKEEDWQEEKGTEKEQKENTDWRKEKSFDITFSNQNISINIVDKVINKNTPCNVLKFDRAMSSCDTFSDIKITTVYISNDFLSSTLYI